MRPCKALTVMFLISCLNPAVLSARSVTDPHNKHNLSITGPGKPGITRSTVEERVCIFCHTPHHANSSPMDQTPLWSRELSNKTYDIYASSSLRATPQQPTGSSRLCLSCHDGTIALGMLKSGKIIGDLSSPLPIGPSNLGGGKDEPDLSDDHPISFPYPSSQSELQPSAVLPPEIRLENGMLQCTACHDPHNDQYQYFLVVDNKRQGSPLCVACHQKSGWTASTHATLDIIYPPIPPKAAEEVFACEACHISHNAQQPRSLLRGSNGKMTCLLTCHNGKLPLSQYGQREDDAFNKLYRHPVGEDPGVHQANEDPLNAMQAGHHVECFDCHNPHSVNSRTATAPKASGRLEGVKVAKLATYDFQLATTEYDVCFKCHSETYSAFRSSPEVLPVRQVDNLNQRSRFNPTNASFHPVIDRVSPVNVTNVTGLKTSYLARNGTSVLLDITSKIYCSDCHEPHGSNEPHMLAYQYAQDSYPSAYYTGDYALCYRCHDESKLLDGVTSSFPPHRSHVQNPANDPLHPNKIPCFVCHDPHGVANSRHLVNFDTRVGFVSPNAPFPVYNSTARSCTVSCHSKGSPDPNTHSY